MMESAVSVRNLHKTYGQVQAVHDLNLDVQPGQMVGLIGPDGGGKTTTLRILCGLLLADDGEVSVLGYDPATQQKKIKDDIGYMPQRFSLYPDLTVAENMRFFADIYMIPRQERIDRTKRLMEFSRLDSFTTRRASALSGGMKQKLALSCTLIHTPRLLILDEPTTGVDPVSRTEFWDILAELKSEGVTILVTTPYMDEAALCDHISLMYGGEILASGTPDDVVKQYPFKLIQVFTSEAYRSAELLEKEGAFRSVELYGDRVHISVSDLETGIEQIGTILERYNISFESIGEADPSLEDMFVYLVKRNR